MPCQRRTVADVCQPGCRRAVACRATLLPRSRPRRRWYEWTCARRAELRLERWPVARSPVLDVHERVGEVNGGSLASSVTLTFFVSLFPLAARRHRRRRASCRRTTTDLAAELIDNLGLTGERRRHCSTAPSTPPSSSRRPRRSSASSACCGPASASPAPSSSVCDRRLAAARAAGCTDRLSAWCGCVGAVVLLGGAIVARLASLNVLPDVGRPPLAGRSVGDRRRAPASSSGCSGSSATAAVPLAGPPARARSSAPSASRSSSWSAPSSCPAWSPVLGALRVARRGVRHPRLAAALRPADRLRLGLERRAATSAGARHGQRRDRGPAAPPATCRSRPTASGAVEPDGGRPTER